MFTTKAYTRLERKKGGGDNDDKFELNKKACFFIDC